MRIMGFQMQKYFREILIAEHRFYIEQVQKRFLSQFENIEIETEADKIAEEYLEKMSVYFNPDKHDASTFYDAACERRDNFYELLSDMRENTRLSVIAGMFHQWDKKLRDWIVREMRHWHDGENATRAIWTNDVPAIMDLLVTFGFDVKALPCYVHLDAMRLVVNVFKHGNGRSLDELKESFPEFFPDSFGERSNKFIVKKINHADIKISITHFYKFSEAILDFWKNVPQEIWLPNVLDAPNWFKKALLKDIKESQKITGS